MNAKKPLTYAQISQKAWPIILANASVPLLGFSDTAVIGNFGTTEDLGAIAFGALIFSFVYWGFGFLRMGTTGFVAQAKGSSDEPEIRAVLGRALFFAIVLGLILICTQIPIREVAFFLLNGSPEVEDLAESYFTIRILGAPATLATFALMGLLIGLGNSRQLLAVQLFLNSLNIGLDIYFAGVLNLGAAGIALGTVIAEAATAIFAGILVYGTLKRQKSPDEDFFRINSVFDKSALSLMITANLDIMIRTLLQVFAFAYFINQSAQFGNSVLAANHILLQLISFAAFFLDGFAFVAEALVGQAMGAKSRHRFDVSVERTSILALTAAVLLAAIVLAFGGLIVGWLTNISAIQEAAIRSVPLAGIYILLSFAAFQLDGIYIGASFTRQMRNAAFLSLAVFFVACWQLLPLYGITGLWWALIVYVVARAAALLLYYPELRGKFGL
jgi:MATE family multidrug resistance protein